MEEPNINSSFDGEGGDQDQAENQSLTQLSNIDIDKELFMDKSSKKSFIGTLEELPLSMVDNEYIKTGYRLNFFGFKDVLATMFMWHNETVNVWSHFLGKVGYFVLLVVILVKYPNMSNNG